MHLPSEDKKPLLPEGVACLLRDLIQERVGIYFDGDRLESLIEKLEPVALRLNCYSYLDLYYHLKYDEQSKAQWDHVMETLSVQETYFWREYAQINTLVTKIVPEWFANNTRPLKIWSCASATGEEAYGIAIALLEAGWGAHPIEIYGTDFSPSALQKATQAIYRENSFRAFPPAIKQKYFTQEQKGWKLNENVSRRVKFQRANLMAPDEISSLARSPVIFCRNVFIYFSPHSIRQTVATFASRMPKGGYLFLGASESLLRLTTDFELKEIGEALAYVRT